MCCLPTVSPDWHRWGDKEKASTWRTFQYIRWDKPNLHYETQIPGATPVLQITFPHTLRGQDLDPSRSNQHCHRRWLVTMCGWAETSPVIASFILVPDIYPTDWITLRYCRWNAEVTLQVMKSLLSTHFISHSSLPSDTIHPNSD